jgi:hypothetical protein
MKTRKKICTCLLFAMFLMLLIAQAQMVRSEESDTPKKALTFLTDVVQLDTSKYNVTLSGYKLSYPTPPLLSDPAVIVQEDLKYTLEREGSKVNAIFGFKNGTFWWCNLYVVEGAPLYAELQPESEIGKAEAVLERYHQYNEVPNFQVTRALLDTLTKTESTTVTLGNTKLEVTEDTDSTRFEWSQIYNGVDTTTVNIRFLNGTLRSFTNSLCLETIGGTDVNISEEQAIQIAVERAKSFSWKAGTDPNNMTEVKDFTVLESPIKAELSMQPREGTTLYPYWMVDLYLDKVYPGGVSSIEVGLWADTGEIHLIQELSYGGDLSNVTTTSTPAPTLSASPSSEPVTATSQVENSKTTPLDTALIAGIAAIISTVAIVAVIAKKKRSK